jgi:hypothetical protein
MVHVLYGVPGDLNVLEKGSYANPLMYVFNMIVGNRDVSCVNRVCVGCPPRNENGLLGIRDGSS